MLGFNAISQTPFASLPMALGHVSTVAGTTALGDETVTAAASATIDFELISATTALGTLASVTGKANVFPTGISLLLNEPNVIVWGELVAVGGSSWSDISTGVSQTWTDIEA
jgi:hypothetical protein